MRTSPLLALALLCGCSAHTHYFRGVDRAFYRAEIEEMDPDAAQEEAVAISGVSAQPLVEAPSADEPAAESTSEHAPDEPEITWLAGEPLTREGTQGRAEWSPDGARILFQSVRPGLDGNPWEQTFLMGADGSNQRRISTGIGKTHGATVVPGEGFTIAYASTHLGGTTPPRTDGEDGESADPTMELFAQDLMTGGFEALAEGPGFDGEPHFCAPQTFAFSSGRTGDLEVYLSEDGAVRAPAPHLGPDESPRLSPDCAALAWVRRDPSGASLVLLDLSLDEPQPLLLVKADRLETPAFARDGESLFFAADLASPGGPLDLFLVTRDGALRRLTASEAEEWAPRPAPDGATLLFTSDAEGSPQLLLAPLDPATGAPFLP